MRAAWIALLVAIALFVSCITLVDYTNAATPTTLEEAFNRPVVIKKYVDKENNVVCYWNERHPADIECLQVQYQPWGTKDAK